MEQTKEIVGKKYTLLFYYPLGNDELHAQVYKNKTDDVVQECIVKDDQHRKFIELMFDMTWNYTARKLPL